MQNDLDYNRVPITFLHCTHTVCIQAKDCLRYKLMLYVTPDRASLPIVNPALIPDKGRKCPYFVPDCKVKFALGITHLLDNIPHSKAVIIKRELYVYFRRNIYYRILHKERLISPAEQDFIRKLFIDNGVKEEPLFDKYVEQYEWL